MTYELIYKQPVVDVTGEIKTYNGNQLMKVVSIREEIDSWEVEDDLDIINFWHDSELVIAIHADNFISLKPISENN